MGPCGVGQSGRGAGGMGEAGEPERVSTATEAEFYSWKSYVFCPRARLP